jgi:hypothetical protein
MAMQLCVTRSPAYTSPKGFRSVVSTMKSHIVSPASARRIPASASTHAPRKASHGTVAKSAA